MSSHPDLVNVHAYQSSQNVDAVLFSNRAALINKIPEMINGATIISRGASQPLPLTGLVKAYAAMRLNTSRSIPPHSGRFHPSHINRAMGIACIKCPSPLQSPPAVSPIAKSRRIARGIPEKISAAIFMTLALFTGNFFSDRDLSGGADCSSPPYAESSHLKVQAIPARYMRPGCLCEDCH